MLRIKIELIPGGREAEKRELACAEIANVSALQDASDYAVAFCEKENRVAGTAAWRGKGFVRGHNRQQSVWRLVAKACVVAAAEAPRISGQ
jgi:hypothetical protein